MFSSSRGEDEPIQKGSQWPLWSGESLELRPESDCSDSVLLGPFFYVPVTQEWRRHLGSGQCIGAAFGVVLCMNWRVPQSAPPDTGLLALASGCCWTGRGLGATLSSSYWLPVLQAYYARYLQQPRKVIWQKEIKLVSYSPFHWKSCTWGDSHSQGDRYCAERAWRPLFFLCSFKACVDAKK